MTVKIEQAVAKRDIQLLASLLMYQSDREKLINSWILQEVYASGDWCILWTVLQCGIPTHMDGMACNMGRFPLPYIDERMYLDKSLVITDEFLDLVLTRCQPPIPDQYSFRAMRSERLMRYALDHWGIRGSSQDNYVKWRGYPTPYTRCGATIDRLQLTLKEEKVLKYTREFDVGHYKCFSGPNAKELEYFNQMLRDNLEIHVNIRTSQEHLIPPEMRLNYEELSDDQISIQYDDPSASDWIPPVFC